MPLYSFKCVGCGATQTIQSSISDYDPQALIQCLKCRGAVVRDYRADKPQPAPMWPEHYNPSTGTVVRSRRQMQDDLNRGAEEQYERTGIPSNPVVVDRADLPSFRKDT